MFGYLFDWCVIGFFLFLFGGVLDRRLEEGKTTLKNDDWVMALLYCWMGLTALYYVIPICLDALNHDKVKKWLDKDVL